MHHVTTAERCYRLLRRRRCEGVVRGHQNVEIRAIRALIDVCSHTSSVRRDALAENGALLAGSCELSIVVVRPARREAGLVRLGIYRQVRVPMQRFVIRDLLD